MLYGTVRYKLQRRHWKVILNPFRVSGTALLVNHHGWNKLGNRLGRSRDSTNCKKYGLGEKNFLILSWNVKCPLYCPWNVKRPLYFPWNVIRTPPLPPSEKALILRIFVVSLTGLARLTQIVLTDKLADWSGTSWLHFSEIKSYNFQTVPQRNGFLNFSSWKSII